MPNNALLNHLISFLRNDQAGTLASFPDQDDPDDVGGDMTQDDVDFVKRLRKEIDRFGICSSDKTGIGVTSTDPDNLVIEWDDDGTIAVAAAYRVTGDVTWIYLPGIATSTSYAVPAGVLAGGTDYDFRIQAVCANGEASSGSITTATTDGGGAL